MAVKKTITLLVLDGWGIGGRDISNPIHQAKTPNLDFLKENYPLASLQASGIAVGLPWNEPGNSEVGHLTMGSGQVIYQHYPRISIAIENGSFFQNPVLLQAINFAKQNKSTLHLIGLLTSGIVHAAYDHLLALIKLCKQNDVQNVVLHLFTDGRDSQPREAKTLLKKISDDLAAAGVGKIATLIGRFYSMDHEGEWLRIERAFNLIVENVGEETKNYTEELDRFYENPKNTDEYLAPLVLSKEKFQNGDAAIFFNFREDGIRELVRAFVDPEFKEFQRPQRKNIFIATFTKLFEDIALPVAFPMDPPAFTLAKTLALYQMRQLKLGETAKSSHITFFFNGLSHETFPLEYRKIFPASEKSIFDDPAMRSNEIADALTTALHDKIYDFILVNFATPDMVAHTGDFSLGIQAAEIIDGLLGRIYKTALNTDSVLIVTADHGNLERMRNPETAELETAHNLSPVPFVLIGNGFEKKKSSDDVMRIERHVSGTLADVTPTILELLGIRKQEGMTGLSLLPEIR